MKEVYEALEKIEGGDKLVELVKASVTKNGELEQDVRKLTDSAKQYEDIDLAVLKTASEFIENNGGVKSLQEAIAKAEGYDTNEGKLAEQKKEYDDLVLKHSDESTAFQAQLAESNLRADLLPQFVEAFKGSNVLLDRAISTGIVGKDENGVFYNDGTTKVKLSDGGFDKLKEHPDYSFALNLPTGGDEGAGSGAGNITNNKQGSMLERLEADHQA